MKKKDEKLRSRRIAVGIAGLVIAMAVGIGLAVLIGQKRDLEQPREEQTGMSDSDTNMTEGDSAQQKEEQTVSQQMEEQTVILGVMNASPLLNECVRNFNEGDHGYQVMIQSYYSQEQNMSWEDARLRMQMALSGSTGPDIVLVESLDVNALAGQGMLEDLTPYFAESELVHREDFLESVTASYTYDGKWVALPRWITIQTLWGKPGIVGDTPGWTVQEMLALAERYPDLPITGQFARWEFLTYCLVFMPETFWLEPGGGVKEELKEVLEQASSYPAQIDYPQWDERCLQVCREEALLVNLEVYKLETLLYLQEFAGEDGLIPIGYPTLGGAPKALLAPANGLYAIPANASNKEGAWAFLELFFAGELDPGEREGLFYQASGIPVCKKELEQELLWELQQWEMRGTEDLDEEEIALIEEWLDELTAMAGVYSSSAMPFLNIIAEEGELYFEGVKTLEEALEVIENRGRLYFQENGDDSRGE